MNVSSNLNVYSEPRSSNKDILYTNMSSKALPAESRHSLSNHNMLVNRKDNAIYAVPKVVRKQTRQNDASSVSGVINKSEWPNKKYFPVDVKSQIASTTLQERETNTRIPMNQRIKAFDNPKNRYNNRKCSKKPNYISKKDNVDDDEDEGLYIEANDATLSPSYVKPKITSNQKRNDTVLKVKNEIGPVKLYNKEQQPDHWKKYNNSENENQQQKNSTVYFELNEMESTDKDATLKTTKPDPTASNVTRRNKTQHDVPFRPLSMPPCDPPLPPSEACFENPTNSAFTFGSRPLPPTPRMENNDENETTAYCNMEPNHPVIERKSSIPSNPPPEPPISEKTVCQLESEYCAPVDSSLMSSVSESCQVKSFKKIATSSATRKKPFSVAKSKFESIEEKQSTRTNNITTSKIYPAARILKSKKSKEQLEKLPFRLKFQQSSDENEEEISTTKFDSNFGASNEFCYPFASSHRESSIVKPHSSPKIKSNSKSSSAATTNHDVLLGAKSFGDLPLMHEKSEIEISKNEESDQINRNLSQVQNKENISVKIISRSSLPPPPSLSVANLQQYREMKHNVEHGLIGSTAAASNSSVALEKNPNGIWQKNNKVTALEPFKRRIDKCGYTLHKLHIERLERQLKQGISNSQDLTESISPPSSAIEDKGSKEKEKKHQTGNYLRDSTIQSNVLDSKLKLNLTDINVLSVNPNTPTKTSPSEITAKSDRWIATTQKLTRSPKSITRPNVPPPPRPAIPSAVTKPKRAPARPPPPTKQNIEQAKLRRNLSSCSDISSPESFRISKVAGIPHLESIKIKDTRHHSSPDMIPQDIQDDTYYSAIMDFSPDAISLQEKLQSSKIQNNIHQNAVNVGLTKPQSNQIAKRNIHNTKNVPPIYSDFVHCDFSDDEAEGIYVGIDDE